MMICIRAHSFEFAAKCQFLRLGNFTVTYNQN